MRDIKQRMSGPPALARFCRTVGQAAHLYG